MVRALLGFIKGGLVGAAVGFGAWKAGLGAGVTGYLVYGVVGFLTGIVCGKAIWRQETLVTPIIKGIAGFVLGMGLFWVAQKALGGTMTATVSQVGIPVGVLLAVPVGILYGIFVEVDDGERKGAGAGSSEPPKSAG